MHRSNSSLVNILKRMEKNGLVRRQSDLHNKKFTRVVITEKGQAIYMKALHLSAFDAVISCLPRKDQQMLKKYLDILFKAAEEYVT